MMRIATVLKAEDKHLKGSELRAFEAAVLLGLFLPPDIHLSACVLRIVQIHSISVFVDGMPSDENVGCSSDGKLEDTA